MTAQGAPDWTLLGGIAALLTALGGVVAAVMGAFRQKNNGQDTRTEQTLGNAFNLINELQEERDSCAKRIDKLEAEVVGLRNNIKALEAELRQAHRPQ